MFEQRRVWRITIFSLDLFLIRRTPRHAVSFTHFSSGLIPYINHFHYGINIKQFSKWKSYCCCWVTNKATLNSTDVFHWYYLHHPIQLFPSNHPINTRQFAITTEIEGFDTLLFWRISFIYKKSRTRHLDASDTYIILKNNLNHFPFKNNL